MKIVEKSKHIGIIAFKGSTIYNAAAILAFAALNPHASSRQIKKKVELVSDLY